MQPADAVNVAQAAAWDGEEGDDWVANADHHDAALVLHNARLREGARIAVDERVLDVGCGNGQTTATRRAQRRRERRWGSTCRRRCWRVRATAAAEGLTNVTFRQADAQVHRFEDPPFDVAISRFGVMFFDDPIAAFSNIGRALRPGGPRRAPRVAGAPEERVGRVSARRARGRSRAPLPPADGPGPFSFAEPDRVRSILERAGFEAVGIASVEEPLSPGVDADDAFQFFRGSGIVRGLLSDLDDRDRERGLDALRATLVAHDTGHGVQFGSAAWLVTAHRG